MTPSARVLAVTGGHAFNRPAFEELLASLSVSCTEVQHPDAYAQFTKEAAAGWDAYLLYDMPGYEFQADRSAPRLMDPPPEFRRDFLDLVERGHGFVFLHHSLAAWPAWADYAAVVGGRFRFVRDDEGPDSGYRHAVNQHISVLAPDHPVVAGLGDGFDIVDELYLAEDPDTEITPLLRTDAELTDRSVWSTWNAVIGRRDSNDGWSHPPGSGLVGWVRDHPRSRIVYLQFGDGPEAFGNPAFRRLLDNALTWVAESRDALSVATAGTTE